MKLHVEECISTVTFVGRNPVENIKGSWEWSKVQYGAKLREPGILMVKSSFILSRRDSGMEHNCLNLYYIHEVLNEETLRLFTGRRHHQGPYSTVQYYMYFTQPMRAETHCSQLHETTSERRVICCSPPCVDDVRKQIMLLA